MTMDSKMGQGGRAVRARFAPKADGETGTRVRVLVAGVHARDLDLTGNVTGAIAHALWQARGGDAASNWVEAERIVEQLATPAPRPSVAAAEVVRAEATSERVGVGAGVSARRR